MNILIPIKRVVDPYAKVRPSADGASVDTSGQKFEINPFDEIAVEEAVRVRERGENVEITVISIGGAECEEQLRKALAMGADKALLVETNEDYDSPSVASELAAVAMELKPDLILMGKQATDDDCNQAGQMLAAKYTVPSTITGAPRAGHSEINRPLPSTRASVGPPRTRHCNCPSRFKQYKKPSSQTK